jgi:hypothetical protein
MVLPPRPYDNMDNYRQALEHEEGGLHEALEVLMNCEPHAVAHGHSIHSFRGTIERAEEDVRELEKFCDDILKLTLPGWALSLPFDE